MTKTEIRRAAKVRILNGKTKQETFDELKEHYDSAENLAKIIQGIPSLKAREQTKTWNIVLIILLSLTVLFKLITGISLIAELGTSWLPLLLIMPLINVILLIGVITYSAGIHKAVAIFTIIGLLNSLKHLSNASGDPLSNLINIVIAAGLIALGFYLNSVLSSEYRVGKESYHNEQGKLEFRDVITFED